MHTHRLHTRLTHTCRADTPRAPGCAPCPHGPCTPVHVCAPRRSQGTERALLHPHTGAAVHTLAPALALNSSSFPHLSRPPPARSRGAGRGGRGRAEQSRRGAPGERHRRRGAERARRGASPSMLGNNGYRGVNHEKKERKKPAAGGSPWMGPGWCCLRS